MSVICKEVNGKKQYQANIYYRDEFDQPRRKTSRWFKRKSDAKQAEKELKIVKKEPKVKLTFERLCLEWIDSTKDRNTPKTTKDKLQTLYNYLTPMLKMHPNKITSLTIKSVFDQPKIQKLSVSRKNRIRGVLVSTLKYGMWLYDLEKNPADTFPTFKENKVKEPYVVYTPQQLLNVLQMMDEKHHEHRNALVFLFFSGMRLNECLSLTFNDIKKNGLKVRVWRQYVKGKWVLLKNKGSTRTIDLPIAAQKVWQEQIEKYKDCPGYNDGWFLFGGERQLPANTLRRVYKKAQKDAQLPESRIHDLRHGHASILIEHMDKEEDIFKISQRLGHSSVSTTLEIYAHVLDSSEEKFMSILNNLCFQ